MLFRSWYHTHPHGESHQQVLDGMSGALIVEGIERYAPRVRNLRERILVIRATDIEHDPRAAAKRTRVEVQQSACGESRDEVDRLFTVNVPTGGSVDVVMDFTDPIIRGMSVFHCHLLNHEDKGMMAKILFE